MLKWSFTPLLKSLDDYCLYSKQQACLYLPLTQSEALLDVNIVHIECTPFKTANNCGLILLLAFSVIQKHMGSSGMGLTDQEQTDNFVTGIHTSAYKNLTESRPISFLLVSTSCACG